MKPDYEAQARELWLRATEDYRNSRAPIIAQREIAAARRQAREEENEACAMRLVEFLDHYKREQSRSTYSLGCEDAIKASIGLIRARVEGEKS